MREDDSNDHGPDGTLAAAAAAGDEATPVQPAPAHPGANAWGRQGRLAIQTSHSLTAPLVRMAPERVECETHPSAPGADSEAAPDISIPETVLHARPRPRMSEDAVRRSPIAGLVIAVSVSPGQAVKRHQPVLIIEAMKMQNNVGPEIDGVVKTIHVAPGDAVKAGQVLFELA